MKILYVDLQFDYGQKKRGINFIGRDGFASAFKKLGHNLEVFFYDSYLNRINQLQKDLINQSEIIQPDLIFFQTFTDQFLLQTLDLLKSKFQTIAWFGDDSWRFDIYTKYLANHFTWCVTTDKFSIPRYHKIGQKNVILSQWAAIDSHPLPIKKEKYDFDVSFVGAMNPYRQWFVKYLYKKGIKVITFGFGWPNGQVSNTQMNEIFMNSKINLNISNSENYDIRYLFHFPFSSKALLSGIQREKLRPFVTKAREWKKIIFKTRGIKNFGQIKARNFEIPFFGGFQLTDYNPGIEDYFEIGNEIACYNTIDEAVLLIKHYLDSEEKRKEIAEKSHQKAISTHGYVNRMASILNKI